MPNHFDLETQPEPQLEAPEHAPEAFTASPEQREGEAHGQPQTQSDAEHPVAALSVLPEAPRTDCPDPEPAQEEELTFSAEPEPPSKLPSPAEFEAAQAESAAHQPSDLATAHSPEAFSLAEPADPTLSAGSAELAADSAEVAEASPLEFGPAPFEPVILAPAEPAAEFGVAESVAPESDPDPEPNPVAPAHHDHIDPEKPESIDEPAAPAPPPIPAVSSPAAPTPAELSSGDSPSSQPSRGASPSFSDLLEASGIAIAEPHAALAEPVPALAEPESVPESAPESIFGTDFDEDGLPALEALPGEPPRTLVESESEIVAESADGTRSVLRLHLAVHSDIGCVRSNNEDSYGYDQALGLYIVCDGMGGMASGEIASALAVSTAVSTFAASAGAGLPVSTRLSQAISAANRAVWDYGQQPEHRGMGTTLVAAAVDGDAIIIGNVGDSRAYMLHAGQCMQLTVDHSYVNELIRNGTLTLENAHRADLNGMESVITRAIGAAPDVQPDFFSIYPSPGDQFLLASDGLTRYMNQDEILQVLFATDLQNAPLALIDIAKQRGGVDNITCLLLRASAVAA